MGFAQSNAAVNSSPSRAPLVSVVLTNSIAFRNGDLAFDTLSVEYFFNPRSFETFDIYIHAREDSGCLSISCQFNTNIFTRDTIYRYLSAYDKALWEITHDDGKILDQIDLATPNERGLFSNATDNNRVQDRAKRRQAAMARHSTRKK